MEETVVLVDMEAGCFFPMEGAQTLEGPTGFLQCDVFAHQCGEIGSSLNFFFDFVDRTILMQARPLKTRNVRAREPSNYMDGLSTVKPYTLIHWNHCIILQKQPMDQKQQRSNP